MNKSSNETNSGEMQLRSLSEEEVEAVSGGSLERALILGVLLCCPIAAATVGAMYLTSSIRAEL
jgi:hypothetical protein